jgi:uncharacterized NAD(P)/FAD-binding protein YdhS
MEYSSLTMIAEASADLPELAYYDLAIVGAGVSSAYTLIHYIAGLEQQAAAIDLAHGQQHVPVRIIVTEKSDEFWTGLPYGSRSGRNALLISPLHEFIPQQLERQNFIDWLTTNRDRVFNPAEYNQGELSRKWLAANSADMSEGRWDDLFIPRHTFGLYLKERLDRVLTAATAKGLIEFKLVTADVLDVQNISDSGIEDLYQIDLAATAHPSFLAKKIVLAIGSPPNVAFAQDQSAQPADGICYIDNMYEPSLDFNLDRICQSLQQADSPSQRQILMVGSNAGTLDTLYNINNSKTAVSLIDKFVIISPNAAFPYRISKGIVELNYSPQHLLALIKTSSFTAKQMFEAIEQDVAAAIAQDINISDIHGDISKVTMQALNLLNPAEQKQFVIRYSVDIGKLQRRAGGEYLDVVNNLIAQNKLEFRKGKFVKYSAPISDKSNCEYRDSENITQPVLDTPISIIINCAGFQDVTKSSSILIQNLIRRGICIPNDSNRGFVTDKDFKANTNCYLMGPLVAGNIDGDFKVWHAESCQRIIGLSERLAAALQQSEPQIAVVPTVENTELLVGAV